MISVQEKAAYFDHLALLSIDPTPKDLTADPYLKRADIEKLLEKKGTVKTIKTKLHLDSTQEQQDIFQHQEPSNSALKKGILSHENNCTLDLLDNELESDVSSETESEVTVTKSKYSTNQLQYGDDTSEELLANPSSTACFASFPVALRDIVVSIAIPLLS